MAEGLRRELGGICQLAELISEYGEQIEYDLIQHNLRLSALGTHRLSWRDLKVILKHQNPHKSALQRCLQPEDVDWDTQNMLLAQIADVLNLTLWAKTKDGQKNRNKPKPIPRPGYKPKVYGHSKDGGMTLEEARKWAKTRHVNR